MATKESPPKRWAGEASDLGDRLRMARKRAGLTLRQVAEPSGLSIAYLSDLERGVLSNPTLDKLAAIASTLGVTVDSLLGIHDPGPEAVPAPLEEFLQSTEFSAALEALAGQSGVSQAILERDWRQALMGLSISGQRPTRALDYLLIFEAIRRSLDA